MNKYTKTFFKTGIPFGVGMGVFDAWGGKDTIDIIGRFIFSALFQTAFFGGVMTALFYIWDKKYNKNGEQELHQKKEYIINRNIEEVMVECKNAIQTIKRSKIISEEGSGGNITAKVGINWKTIGEKINVKGMPLGTNSTKVEIYSSPSSSATILDWGKNRENVEAISAYLGHKFGNSIKDA